MIIREAVARSSFYKIADNSAEILQRICPESTSIPEISLSNKGYFKYVSKHTYIFKRHIRY